MPRPALRAFTVGARRARRAAHPPVDASARSSWVGAPRVRRSGGPGTAPSRRDLRAWARRITALHGRAVSPWSCVAAVPRGTESTVARAAGARDAAPGRHALLWRRARDADLWRRARDAHLWRRTRATRPSLAARLPVRARPTRDSTCSTWNWTAVSWRPGRPSHHARAEHASHLQAEAVDDADQRRRPRHLAPGRRKRVMPAATSPARGRVGCAVAVPRPGGARTRCTPEAPRSSHREP